MRFRNRLGQLLIASGEAAAAVPGRPPERRIVVKPRRAVEWALYYPPLLDTRPERYPEALRPAVLAYRRNDFTAAFAALDGVPEGARDARYHTLRAGLLLSVGRVSEAEGDLTSAQRLDPKNGIAYALRSVIAVVRNEQEEALKLAAEAVRLAPGSATPYVARSYAEQSAFEIEKARESLEEASRLAPEDALVWARLAEIELSLGDLDAALEAATKAETLDPDLARTETVLGFAYLTRIEVDEAKAAFERAIARDPADPLPRLGLGLAKIRDGDIDAGTKEIETAASLDPNNSLVRSYLGKAYYEQKRGGLAETEYEQAKLLDPKDPTPWFYDAIHKQTTNRPVEALHDLQKAIDLNDNRAVYRSRLLLDQDFAARSAAVGRIYRDLGFEQRALVEGWKSVNTDPSDYSGHRFLADSYSALPRHEVARVSELLQSQLLQPLNVTPVQPQLGESNLLILDAAGPAVPAFNEFNPLFLRNRLTFQASGVAGSNGTYGDEIVHSGLWDKLSYSLGQFHSETQGFRKNNDLSQDLYNVFVQSRIAPTLNLQAEYRHREIEHGDLQFNFALDAFNESFRRQLRTDSVRVGTRVTLAPHSDLIVSAIYQDETEAQNFGTDRTNFDSRGFITETQYIFRVPRISFVMGGGYYKVEETFIDQDVTTGDVFLSGSDNTDHTNGYIYSYIKYPRDVFWTLGVSYDSLTDSLLGEFHQPNPKIGAIWNMTPNTTLRFAVFETLKRALLTDQTIEPTQVSGFNQFFDDNSGTASWRYGVAFDQRIAPAVFAGIEASRRDLSVPIAIFDQDGALNILKEDWQEKQLRIYLNWAVHPSLALNVGYQLEQFENDKAEMTGTPKTRTHLLTTGLQYFHSTGMFSRMGLTYVDQTVESTNGDSAEDQFPLVDLSVGYRLPKRFGIMKLEIKNVLAEKFNYQGLGLRSFSEQSPLFLPERTVFAQVLLSF